MNAQRQIRLNACGCSRMYLFPNFLSEEQCEHVLQLAKIRLAPSSLALRKSDDAAKQRVRITATPKVTAC